MSSEHSNAQLAAEAAEAAGDQGKYWEMHRALFSHQKRLSKRLILDLSREAGLDTGRFKRERAAS